MSNNSFTASFAGLLDLAAEKVGGKALYATDEFFAEKENLLKEGRGVFIVDKYTERGKWMDGWESRRKRTEGYDYCLIKLGVKGFIKGFDIDTNHFLGNHPPYASVDACCVDEDISSEDLDSEQIEWTEILKRSPLNPGSQNLFSVNSDKSWTHLRLNIYPDGGVARFRAYGEADKNWENYNSQEMIDLAALVNGGRVILCNDMFFGSKDNLINPGPGKNMGDGWETKRKRILPGFDWSVIKLATPGELRKIIVDTKHFKGNFPESCSIDACYMPEVDELSLSSPDIDWTEILPRTKLGADQEHHFEDEIQSHEVFSHVRLNIYPDGGISRLRLFGYPRHK